MQFAASSLDGRDSHYLGTYLAKQVPRYVKVLYQTTYIHLLQDFYYAQLQNGSNRVRTAIHPDNIGLHVCTCRTGTNLRGSCRWEGLESEMPVPVPVPGSGTLSLGLSRTHSADIWRGPPEISPSAVDFHDLTASLAQRVSVFAAVRSHCVTPCVPAHPPAISVYHSQQAIGAPWPSTAARPPKHILCNTAIRLLLRHDPKPCPPALHSFGPLG